MQKTILIPTDFQVESLNTLKLALKHNDGHQVTAVLLYGEQTGDSIRELLFYSPQRRISLLSKTDFIEALSIIRNRFSKTLVRVNTELFHGHNLPALKAFLDGRKIDEIYIPQSYKLKQTKGSFDVLPLLKRSELPVYPMNWSSDISLNSNDQLGALFVN